MSCELKKWEQETRAQKAFYFFALPTALVVVSVAAFATGISPGFGWICVAVGAVVISVRVLGVVKLRKASSRRTSSYGRGSNLRQVAEFFRGMGAQTFGGQAADRVHTAQNLSALLSGGLAIALSDRAEG